MRPPNRRHSCFEAEPSIVRYGGFHSHGGTPLSLDGLSPGMLSSWDFQVPKIEVQMEPIL